MHRIEDRGEIIVKVEILPNCPPKTIIFSGSLFFSQETKYTGLEDDLQGIQA